jgi:glycosyltransferase involved in cell wall biosynthesis
MATYNGSQFISLQIESILKQLGDDDEVIVVDDLSTDNTVSLISAFNDARIKIFQNQHNLGHVKAFDRAIALSKNEFIFLSDQDDVWIDGRVSKMLDCLMVSHKSVLTSNSVFIDAKGFLIEKKIHPIKSKESAYHLQNILRIFSGGINYFGCTMVFDRNIAQVALPIPRYIESHDLWIAMIGNILAINLHIDDETIYRRIHGSNVTNSNRSIFKKIYSRVIFLISFIHIIYRVLYKI